jgi:regulatory protein
LRRTPERGGPRLPSDPTDAGAAFERALRILQAAAQTSAALTRRLARAGFDEGAVASAVDRARELGYVNDRAIAEAAVRRRLASGRGIGVIRRELGAKGVERELVDSVLAEIDTGAVISGAVAEARRLAARHADQPEARRREKVISGLVRRGHSGSAARRAWESLAEVPE